MRPGVAASLILVMGLVLAITAPVRAHPPSIVSSSAEKAVADEIRAFRKSLADAVEAKDKKRLGDLYAPSFQHTNEAGRVSDRDAHLAALLAGAPGIETAAAETLGHPHSQRLGGDRDGLEPDRPASRRQTHIRPVDRRLHPHRQELVARGQSRVAQSVTMGKLPRNLRRCTLETAHVM